MPKFGLIHQYLLVAQIEKIPHFKRNSEKIVAEGTKGCLVQEDPSSSELLQQGNIGIWGRAEEEFVSVLQYHLVNVMPASQPKKRSSKRLFNYGARSTNHATVGLGRIKGDSEDLVSNLIRFQQAKDSSCYFSPGPINGNRYSKKLFEVGPSKHKSDPLLRDPRCGSILNPFVILVENKGRRITEGFFFNALCFSFSGLSPP